MKAQSPESTTDAAAPRRYFKPGVSTKVQHSLPPCRCRGGSSCGCGSGDRPSPTPSAPGSGSHTASDYAAHTSPAPGWTPRSPCPGHPLLKIDKNKIFSYLVGWKATALKCLDCVPHAAFQPVTSPTLIISLNGENEKMSLALVR